MVGLSVKLFFRLVLLLIVDMVVQFEEFALFSNQTIKRRASCNLGEQSYGFFFLFPSFSARDKQLSSLSYEELLNFRSARKTFKVLDVVQQTSQCPYFFGRNECTFWF